MSTSQKTLKPKTCKSCKGKFIPERPLQSCCSIPCAMENSRKIGNRNSARKRLEASRIHRQEMDKVKTRAEWIKEAQAAFNKFIRLRDDDLSCVSCGRHHTGQYHAGHYLSTGARPELRFEELNVHKQCSMCNNYLSGNLVLYRAELINRIGIEKVEWLEGSHPPKKYTIEELKAIKALYLQKCKELS